MENPIDLLWTDWNENDMQEVPAVNAAYYTFGLKEDDKKEDVFYHAVTDAKEVAFKAGFRTALKLLASD